MQDQINRIDRRLAKMEKMLRDALDRIPPEKSKRVDEKVVCQEYGVSKHVLRRLRLGYKRSDGADIPPVLFKWGHRKGRQFDYDREELEKIIGRKLINNY